MTKTSLDLSYFSTFLTPVGSRDGEAQVSQENQKSRDAEDAEKYRLIQAQQIMDEYLALTGQPSGSIAVDKAEPAFRTFQVAVSTKR